MLGTIEAHKGKIKRIKENYSKLISHDSNWLSIAGSKEIKVSLELAVGISRVGGVWKCRNGNELLNAIFEVVNLLLNPSL